MTAEEKLAEIRKFCGEITVRTLWEGHEIAAEIRDFIDDRLPGGLT